jgi:peptide/nickel transport system permease protein
MSVLIVTHNLGVIADVCDRVIVLYAGQVFEEADVFELFDIPLNPYTLGLLNANPAHAKPGQPLQVIPGRVPPPGSWPKGCRFAPRCAFTAPKCLAGPIPLVEPASGRYSRCIRIDEIVLEHANGQRSQSVARSTGLVEGGGS